MMGKTSVRRSWKLLPVRLANMNWDTPMSWQIEEGNLKCWTSSQKEILSACCIANRCCGFALYPHGLGRREGVSVLLPARGAKHSWPCLQQAKPTESRKLSLQRASEQACSPRHCWIWQPSPLTLFSCLKLCRFPLSRPVFCYVCEQSRGEKGGRSILCKVALVKEGPMEVPIPEKQSKNPN